MNRRRVDLGNGEVEAAVAGDGPITVVFESGLGSPLEIWDGVVAPVSARARTLRYDRRQAALTGKLVPRTVPDLLADLETLLAALALKPPYVFVGHSWGGVIARLFACAHPSDVAALVLVDATHEAVDSRILSLLPVVYSVVNVLCRLKRVQRGLIGQLCPAGCSPAYRARIEQRFENSTRRTIGLRTSRAEGAAIRPALAQLRRDCAELPSVPTRVLTAGSVNSKMARINRAAWKATADRAAAARYTNVDMSGHLMPIDSPDVVVDAIASVLDNLPLARTS